MNLRSLSERSGLVFILAILLAFLIPGNMSSLKIGIELTLGIVMFFAIRPFFKKPVTVKGKMGYVLHSILLNYILLSGVYIALAYLIIGPSNPYFIGYVLIALVPPAVSIVPLCYLTHCDQESADIALFTSYILALIIIPVGLFVVLHAQFDYGIIARIIIILIIIPTSAAYFFAKSELKLFEYSKSITNLAIGLLIFISVALNKQTLLDFTNPVLIKIYLINAVAIGITGTAVYLIARRTREHKESTNYALYASQKNVGTAITLAVFLFNPLTAIPAIIALILQFIYFIILERIVGRFESHGS